MVRELRFHKPFVMALKWIKTNTEKQKNKTKQETLDKWKIRNQTENKGIDIHTHRKLEQSREPLGWQRKPNMTATN